MLSTSEKDVLRRLGEEYMEYALLPVQKEKIGLWRALNRGKMERPMVLCDQLPWNELAVDESLSCVITDPFWKNIERQLRMTLYKWRNFPLDMVLDPFISITKSVVNLHFGLRPSVTKLGEADTTAFSQTYERVLNTLDDIALIQNQKIIYDAQGTAETMAVAQDIFAGVAPVVSRGIGFHLGIWDYLSTVIGTENCLYMMIDEPEFLHAAMNRCCESVISGIEEANTLLVHDDKANVCHCSHIFTDELLPGCGESLGPVSKNCWCLGLAQLFTSVSPEMFREFELPYIKRMAEHFGGIYYGCCDRVDDRLDAIKEIPNVRKVSCSPWSDRKNFAEQIGDTLVMSNKPNPAYLAVDVFDEDLIRKDLQLTYDLAKANGANLEFILKDVSTVYRKPERLKRWHEIAMEVAGC